MVDGYNSDDHGDFTIEWALKLPVPTTPTESPTVSPTGSPTGTPPPVINLESISSPYSGTTSGRGDDTQVCQDNYVDAHDQSFWIDLPPGVTITIGQTSNAFDSKHYLRYGGANPDDSADAAFRGDTEINCVDGGAGSDEHATETYTNDGSSPVVVYFVIAGHNSAKHGYFTIK